MQLDCPHCGDAFTYDPEAAGLVFNCRHCGLPVQLPTVDQLPPEKLQELRAEYRVALIIVRLSWSSGTAKARGVMANFHFAPIAAIFVMPSFFRPFSAIAICVSSYDP